MIQRIALTYIAILALAASPLGASGPIDDIEDTVDDFVGPLSSLDQDLLEFDRVTPDHIVIWNETSSEFDVYNRTGMAGSYSYENSDGQAFDATADPYDYPSFPKTYSRIPDSERDDNYTDWRLIMPAKYLPDPASTGEQIPDGGYFFEMRNLALDRLRDDDPTLHCIPLGAGEEIGFPPIAGDLLDGQHYYRILVGYKPPGLDPNSDPWAAVFSEC